VSEPGAHDRKTEPARPRLRLVGEVPSSFGSGVLAQLDDDQRAAAQTIDGPLLIVAGPGSGKTRTLTHRIAHLVAERGVAPEACLAITFTRRAADEMRERLAQLLPGQSGKVAIHTFHSLGLAILREHGAAVGLHRGFRIASEGERAAMLTEALGVPASKAETELRTISKAKRSGQSVGETAIYERAMATRNWIDFDDLVGRAVEALADP